MENEVLRKGLTSQKDLCFEMKNNLLLFEYSEMEEIYTTAKIST